MMTGPTGTPTARTSVPATPASTPARRPAPSAPAAAAVTVTTSVSPAASARPATGAAAREATASAPAAPREIPQTLYGVVVVLGGFAVILVSLWLVLVNNKSGIETTSIMGSITTAIAAIGGGFFGVVLGMQGTSSANKERRAAEAAKDAAQAQALRFAAYMDPETAKRLVG